MLVPCRSSDGSDALVQAQASLSSAASDSPTNAANVVGDAATQASESPRRASLPLAQLADGLIQRNAALKKFGSRRESTQLPAPLPAAGTSTVPQEAAESFISDTSESDVVECNLTTSALFEALFQCQRSSSSQAEQRGGLCQHACRRICDWLTPRSLAHLAEQVVHAGVLTKRSKYIGAWRVRWAVLTPTSLKMFKSSGAWRLREKPTESFQLLQVADITVEDTLLVLRLPRRRCSLRCEESAAAETWASYIRMCCERAQTTQ
ncbi:hypothetical protein AK812_SmicGene19047 [Symbiodinium microadriaticum]|uniref:PH domain-containing protein n=1 Tax=Symbiodinium microadriaticum TaxID=2951 RepID=A0A1Q9DTL3_SYMMI|nr:hypothetical protein AK812_SmicGene19047 [Symbiodinium microadriaticum]